MTTTEMAPLAGPVAPTEPAVTVRGLVKRYWSADGAEVLLIEPSSTVNTGDTPSELTAERRVV